MAHVLPIAASFFQPHSLSHALLTKVITKGGSAEVSAIEATPEAGLTEWVSEEVKKSDRPELASAKVVVSGGRGLKTSENFGMLDTLALKLDAAPLLRAAEPLGAAMPNDEEFAWSQSEVFPCLYQPEHFKRGIDAGGHFEANEEAAAERVGRRQRGLVVVELAGGRAGLSGRRERGEVAAEVHRLSGG